MINVSLKIVLESIPLTPSPIGSKISTIVILTNQQFVHMGFKQHKNIHFKLQGFKINP